LLFIWICVQKVPLILKPLPPIQYSLYRFKWIAHFFPSIMFYKVIKDSYLPRLGALHHSSVSEIYIFFFAVWMAFTEGHVQQSAWLQYLIIHSNFVRRKSFAPKRQNVEKGCRL